ncbi:HAD-like domain-containing protein [Leucosporidium creatinivorum]|uniref:HAD-like domain-containing protein n=1 Tax=Leucosporidium creatinivorum TaxID=106004 RepID=A0A1Y2EPZ6_9BASI|nr:HAD-like domain-containing protein [Leucosporidium creatinivorum]
MAPSPLAGVKALLFDVFGTVVDWQGSVHRQLVARAQGDSIQLGEIDLLVFTKEWRAGYMRRTREIAAGAEGPTNVDALHRELLDALLSESKYSVLNAHWKEEETRKELVEYWHRLDGWPDSSPGLQAVKSLEQKEGDDGRRIILGTLSNGSARLLVDLARHSTLPFDLILSGDLLSSYKPNPTMYHRACSLLDLQPEEVGMVASHIYDLRAAASCGVRCSSLLSFLRV